MNELVDAAVGAGGGALGGIACAYAILKFRVGRLEADVAVLGAARQKDFDLLTALRIDVGQLIERVADVKALLMRGAA